MDTIITKSKSSSIKFIAALIMLFYHTFGFENRINYAYTSIFKVNSIPIEQYIAKAGGICVGIFIFLSGYGLYKGYGIESGFKKIFMRIWKFYKQFWIVFGIFIPLGFYLGIYRFEGEEFIKNLLGIVSTYNMEWWFVRLYISLLLIYPILIRIINIFNYKIILVISFVLNVIGYGIPKLQLICGIHSTLVYEFSIVLGGQFLFVFGIITSKYGLYNKIKERININTNGAALMSILTYFIIILITDIYIIGEIAKLLLIPVFIFMLGNTVKEDSKLSRYGNHSTNMWLVHSFFCYYYFQSYTFVLKYSILIFLQLVVICYLMSVGINKLSLIVERLISKKTMIVGIPGYYNLRK